jgi:hypothetical protein
MLGVRREQRKRGSEGFVRVDNGYTNVLHQPLALSKCCQSEGAYIHPRTRS